MGICDRRSDGQALFAMLDRAAAWLRSSSDHSLPLFMWTKPLHFLIPSLLFLSAVLACLLPLWHLNPPLGLVPGARGPRHQSCELLGSGGACSLNSATQSGPFCFPFFALHFSERSRRFRRLPSFRLGPPFSCDVFFLIHFFHCATVACTPAASVRSIPYEWS